MRGLGELALLQEDRDAWIALETDDVAGTVEDLEIELEEVKPRVIRVDQLDDAAVRELDRIRVRHVGKGTVILVGGRDDLERLATLAPHIWSLVGPDYHVLEPEIAFDVSGRLAELQRQTGLTDDDVLRRAGEGELNADPLWAEWLALLGRGDLLER